MKRLLFFFILLAFSVPCQAAYVHYNCGTTVPITLSAWTFPNCEGGTQSNISAASVSFTLANSVTSGNYWQSYVASCAIGFTGGQCASGGSPLEAMITTDTKSQSDGLVTCNGGTDCIFVSGIPFSMANCTWGTCDWAGRTITINGVGKTISNVLDLKHIRMTTNVAVGTAVTYVVAASSCTETVNGWPGAEAVCWGHFTSTGSDTFTTQGSPSTISVLDISQVIVEMHNSGGIVGVDVDACFWQSCGAVGDILGYNYSPWQTTANELSQTLNLAVANEIVIFGATVGTGPVAAHSGWTAVSTGNSNITNSAMIVSSSSGAFTALLNDSGGSGQDDIIAVATAWIPGSSNTASIAVAGITGMGINYVNTATTAVVHGYLTGGSGAENIGPLPQFAPGDLVISGCANNSTSTQTASDSSTHNSWASASTLAGFAHNDLFWTVVQSNGFDTSGKQTETCTVGTARYMWNALAEFSSGTGWPASPVDQVKTATGGSGSTSLTLTATGANAMAGDLEVAIIDLGSGAGSGPDVISSFTSGWHRLLWDQYYQFHIFWKAATSIETASLNVVYPAQYADGILVTFKPNAQPTGGASLNMIPQIVQINGAHYPFLFLEGRDLFALK